MVRPARSRSTFASTPVQPPQELPVHQLIGSDGIAALVRGFYAQVPADPILGPMYPPDDLAGAEARLRGFLIYRWGGPPDYIRERGHPRLRMRHAPFAVDQAARDRWMELMGRSIDQQVAQGMPADVADFIRAFLGDIATFLINR